MNTLVSILVCLAAIAIIALIVWRPGRIPPSALYAETLRREQREERFAELNARLVRRDELQSLLQANQKINAIKLFREDTGASLRDAKEIVERMVATGVGATSSPFMEAESREPTSQSTTEIENCLRAGRKIEAIKIYRAQTGTSLKEAKDAVERIEAEMRSA